MSCDICYWEYERECVCEEEKVHGHISQYTNECIGYLDREFEHTLWDTYTDCVELLGKRSLQQLLAIKEFILNSKPK